MCLLDVMVNFVDQPDERLTCPICKKVFKEPWQTSCGHRFCKNCLEPLLRSPSLRCPVDGDTISEKGSFRDKCCEREVLDLRCCCLYADRNCDWKGEFRHLKTHVDSCQYGDVQCQACGETMERRQLEKHGTNDCVNRAVMCTYCGGKLQQSLMEGHLEVCPRFPVTCNLHCGKEAIPRNMMDEHLAKECPKAEMQCPFSLHGCEFKGIKEAVDKHIKSNLGFHLQMMNKSALESHRKSEEMKEKISRLEQEKNALEQQLQNQTEELVAARINIQTQQTKMSVIEKAVSGQRSDLEKLHRDLEAARGGVNGGVVASQMEEIFNTVRDHEMRVNNLQSDLTLLSETRLTPKHSSSSSSHHACGRRLDRNEHQLALHEIQLSEQDIQIQCLQATSYNGIYLWKIDNYSRRFQEAVSGKAPSIYSPPFYVGRFGYKVCARLYPNGDGMGKGTHISIFFVIMRGEYDALLPWPFLQKVHLRVIDQDKIRDADDSFRPDPNSSSFKRPSSDMNIASGCPTIVSHTELRQGGYIRDDTMYVKINVEMANLQGEIWK